MIKQKYQNRIKALLEDMRIQNEKEELEDEQRYQEYIKSLPENAGAEYRISPKEELPFHEGKETNENEYLQPFNQ